MSRLRSILETQLAGGAGDKLIQKLQQKYRDHMGSFSPYTASLLPPLGKHVASVAVAGFDGTTSVVMVRELRWEKNRKRQWRLIAGRVGKLSFQGCGARFLGEDGIASLLLDASPHFEQEKRRPTVRAVSRANRLLKEDKCFSSVLTVDDAKILYKTAVRMTIDHGEEVHIENVAVGGRLHLLTIPPWGLSRRNLVDPEQYLE